MPVNVVVGEPWAAKLSGDSLHGSSSPNLLAFYSPTVYLLLCWPLSDGEAGVQGPPPAAQRPGLGADAGRGEDEEGERGQIRGVRSKCHQACRNVVK